MMKKLLAILLAGALVLIGFAACGKKHKDNSDNDDFLDNDDMIVDYVLMESRDTAGNLQKDEGGRRIYDRFTFENIDDETVKVIGYVPQVIGSEHMEDGKTVTSYIRCYTPHMVIIPETLIGKRVVSIGDGVFKDSTDLNAVVFPASVTAIGTYAFANCTELTTLTLPASVVSIGEGAFYGCTKLASVTFAETSALEVIPASAFMNCSALTALSIPAYIKTIGTGAFQNCSAIASLTVAEGTTTVEAQAFYGLTARSAGTLPASVTTMGALNFHGCTTLTDAGVTAPAGSVAAQYLDRVLAGDTPTEAVTTAP